MTEVEVLDEKDIKKGS